MNCRRKIRPAMWALRRCTAVASVILTLALGACTAIQPRAPEEGKAAPGAPSVPAEPPIPSITAQTPAVRAYRKSGAAHIYKHYPKRIYPGKIPPLVYAVVVVETHLDANGRVLKVDFSRVPSHAPEVPPMIAKLILDVSPLPNPGSIGAHTYVDTWLWDKSGRFQLDTLTKGQRSR